jgi:FdhD protein
VGHLPRQATSGAQDRELVRIKAGQDLQDIDRVAVEEPLEIRTRERSLAVIMRTPGSDLELVHGFLWSEAILRAGEPLPEVKRPDDAELQPSERGNVVLVDLDQDRTDERLADRNLAVSSSCGVCGAAALAALDQLARPVLGDLRVPIGRILELPDHLRLQQAVFESTGGLHAAGLFRKSGQAIAVREDVGRHNAVDKLIGFALRERLMPLQDLMLCVSGRVSYEIVSKAILAGIPLIAAVSAPSSLAIDLAEKFRVTLCAFVRGDRLNVYSHSHRLQY